MRKVGGEDGPVMSRAKDTLDSVTQPRAWTPKDLETEITQYVKYMTKTLNKLLNYKRGLHRRKQLASMLWPEDTTTLLILAWREIVLGLLSALLWQKCTPRINVTRVKMETPAGKRM